MPVSRPLDDDQPGLRRVQKDLDIQEYADPKHDPSELEVLPVLVWQLVI
ncbi:MAG TPA: hypothetical protein VMA77_23625 [Solirubrobacteraceae bacterium]|nr:hypothetical protein [Solirubrobacteraceae bacterium]